jgi:HPt (histidine-containing phosphotransfer) domain-containing protein
MRISSENLSGEKIDFEVLEQMLELNVVDELIRLFTSSSQSTLEEMKTHLDSGDAVKLADRAHYLKSSSMSVGAVGITEILDRFELLRSAQQIPPTANELFEFLCISCITVAAEIAKWRASVSLPSTLR